MDKQTQQKIWKAVDLYPNPNTLTYRKRYSLIKTLSLGHRPSKTETDEVLFYSVAKLKGLVV